MRRADPERIYQARRAATFRRLADAERLDELDAEHWVSAWEREAETRPIERLSARFWDEGERWIAERRSDPRSRRLG